MELACRNATEEPTEANLVKLLDLWSAGWKHRGRTRAVGPGAYERYATLGLFGHGGVVGVSNATGLREACSAVNPGRYLDVHRRAFQSPHGPAPRHPEHARALESCAGSEEVLYTGGRVWIEDDEGDTTAWLEDKKGSRNCGAGGWTCTTSPSASMRAAIIRSNPTRAACGLLLLMSHKPMLGRRSSTGRHSRKRAFRCRPNFDPASPPIYFSKNLKS